MQKKIILFSVLFVLVSVFSANEIFGLESDTEYFISSDSVYLTLETDTTNNVTITDGAITINKISHEFDMNLVKVLRITNDGDYGRIFGKTVQGDYYYVIYDIDGENVKVLSKLWLNATTTRTIESATIDKLF